MMSWKRASCLWCEDTHRGSRRVKQWWGRRTEGFPLEIWADLTQEEFCTVRENGVWVDWQVIVAGWGCLTSRVAALSAFIFSTVFVEATFPEPGLVLFFLRRLPHAQLEGQESRSGKVLCVCHRWLQDGSIRPAAWCWQSHARRGPPGRSRPE